MMELGICLRDLYIILTFNAERWLYDRNQLQHFNYITFIYNLDMRFTSMLEKWSSSITIKNILEHRKSKCYDLLLAWVEGGLCAVGRLWSGKALSFSPRYRLWHFPVSSTTRSLLNWASLKCFAPMCPAMSMPTRWSLLWHACLQISLYFGCLAKL